jgi:uncharacterized protein (TIGR03083 family)
VNDIEYVPLIDTTRDEMRDRIGEALARFDRLARVADPSARPPGHGWTVQQIVAHVLAIAHRYRAGAQGGAYRRVDTPREIDALNQDELEAVIAPVPNLLAQLHAVAAELDSAFDALTDETMIPFHTFASVSGMAFQTYFLGELLLHGEDIALAARRPWELPERDMLLVVRGLMEVGPAYLRADVSRDTNICVAFKLPGARPYLIHIHDGVAEFRDRRPGDRPDAVMRGPASTTAQMFYGRIGPFAASRRGLLVVGGRRPWRALKLMSCLEGA